MGITIEAVLNLLRKPFTKRYPEEKPEVFERFRGMLEYYPEKCIGCRKCEKNCPSECIRFFRKGKIEFDMGACMFCGECERVCPVSAIKFNNEFENASEKGDIKNKSVK